MLLFCEQFKLTVSEKRSLLEISCFIIRCYLESWICAPNPIAAPLNDIIFLKKLVDFTKFNKKIGEVATKKFSNHLWYLNEESSVFSLFDDCVDNKTKSKMAKRLLEMSDEEGTNKKIILRFDDVSHFLSKDLPFELLSNKSIRFFHRFRISPDFLLKDPSLWENTKEYKDAKTNLATLKVVNDTAERGLKLMEEFNDKFTKQEDQKQFVLQVIQ